MKRFVKAICMVLVLFLLHGFKPEEKTTLLILTDVNNNDTFSTFKVETIHGVLIGFNNEKDVYPVRDGVYRIHGSSNNKLYNHNILVVN